MRDAVSLHPRGLGEMVTASECAQREIFTRRNIVSNSQVDRQNLILEMPWDIEMSKNNPFINIGYDRQMDNCMMVTNGCMKKWT